MAFEQENNHDHDGNEDALVVAIKQRSRTRGMKKTVATRWKSFGFLGLPYEYL
jgi:hypothetical protein